VLEKLLLARSAVVDFSTGALALRTGIDGISPARLIRVSFSPESR
jgi:hypothetical protein